MIRLTDYYTTDIVCLLLTMFNDALFTSKTHTCMRTNMIFIGSFLRTESMDTFHSQENVYHLILKNEPINKHIRTHRIIH